MAIIAIDGKQQQKLSLISGTAPSMGPSSDHTDGSWGVNDIYSAEFFFNDPDQKLWIGSNAGTREILLSGGTASLGNLFTDDITINTTKVIKSTNVGGQIDLDFGGNQGEVAISTDSGNLTESAIVMNSGLFQHYVGGRVNYISVDAGFSTFAGTVPSTIISSSSGTMGNFDNSVMCGGDNNSINNTNSFIGGVVNGINSGEKSALIAGESNEVYSDNSVILGGGEFTPSSYIKNTIGFPSSSAATNCGIVAGNGNVIGSTSSNISHNSFIGGGIENNISGDANVIVAGKDNFIINNVLYSGVIGGRNNIVSNSRAVIVGGSENSNSGARSVIVGGQDHISSGSRSAVIGGIGGTASHINSVILGGSNISTNADDTVFTPDINIQPDKGIIFEGTTERQRMVKLEIGIWDMGSTFFINTAHTLSSSEWQTVHEVSSIIFNDAQTILDDFSANILVGVGPNNISVDNTNIILRAPVTGFFDDGAHTSGGINRGFITFWYTPD